MARPNLSIIIPVYREEARIGALLEHLAALPAPGGAEVLVVDGDPERRTLAALAAQPESAATPLAAARGRARQMNAGALAAQAEALLFLHADTRLPPDALARIEHALADPEICGGAFS
ncbi:MAG: glycosyltransferase, partial [Proteobacteria bacterium]|nr:glycosyltransferase [Pseudomonadota bacterium]